jgi:hypothetical protein
LGFLRTVWHYDPKECAVVTHFLIHSWLCSIKTDEFQGT